MKKSTKKQAKKASKNVKKSSPSVPKMKIQPLGDRVLVKPITEAEERSPFGIIIPESARKEKPETGMVVAVGEGKRTDRGDMIALRVKAGDTIVFSKYGFDEVTIDEQEYYVVAESNILAIINK